MSTPPQVTGYVLAGGASQRFGRDKALVSWSRPGLTLLDHMFELLAHVCSTVHIIGRGPLPDIHPGLGPMGGIETALMNSKTGKNLIVAVDLPFLTADFLKYFKERLHDSQRPLTVCKIGSSFPLCLGIETSFCPMVSNYVHAGGRSLHGLIETHSAAILYEEPLQHAGFSSEIFSNINTIVDYQRALKRVKP